jgi:hypothetical protein
MRRARNHEKQVHDGNGKTIIACAGTDMDTIADISVWMRKTLPPPRRRQHNPSNGWLLLLFAAWLIPLVPAILWMRENMTVGEHFHSMSKFSWTQLPQISIQLGRSSTTTSVANRSTPELTDTVNISSPRATVEDRTLESQSVIVSPTPEPSTETEKSELMGMLPITDVKPSAVTFATQSAMIPLATQSGTQSELPTSPTKNSVDYLEALRSIRLPPGHILAYIDGEMVVVDTSIMGNENEVEGRGSKDERREEEELGKREDRGSKDERREEEELGKRESMVSESQRDDSAKHDEQQ